MTTLIAVYNSEGCVGRCDAKCYGARSGSCDCVCGGMNHGKELDMPTEQTREYAQAWIERARQQDPGIRGETPLAQLGLGVV